jgi:hypothetical protein
MRDRPFDFAQDNPHFKKLLRNFEFIFLNDVLVEVFALAFQYEAGVGLFVEKVLAAEHILRQSRRQLIRQFARLGPD